MLTTHLNDGEQPPHRARHRNAHAYLGAPYGIYQTSDGFIAIAMGSLATLGDLIDLPALAEFDRDPSDRFDKRNDIKLTLARHLQTRSTAEWLSVLEPADYWCSDVLDYQRLLAHPGCRALGMEQTVHRPNGATVRTLRCPIRIDGQRIYSEVAAPSLGNATEQITADPPVSSTRATKAPAPSSGAGSKPLAGMLVVDFGQFLSSPAASLRLADLGARVIKVERPGTGDICRQLYVSNVRLDGESTVFHAINRNKESFCADFKNPTHLAQLKQLVSKADIVMHNFRPGVMEKAGLDHDAVRALNPDVIYATVTGYGTEGPWRDKPGQDLLLQALSGLTWLSGNAGDGPVPMGASIVDIFAGAHLVQGILGCLVRKATTGEGGLVEVSMLESVMDFQFEPLTVYFQDGGEEPQRTASNNAHAYLGAPYGIYATRDGHLALAMGRIPQLGELLGCAALSAYPEPESWFKQRDEIKTILANHLRTKSTADWLAVLEPADIWCADVMDWNSLRNHEGYRLLGMEQTVRRGDGFEYTTTRCPIRFDGVRLHAEPGSPDIGEHNEMISRELLS
jgi:crotonobetainyl-CoA:carnitine CoA-transferase CaiB-like acyl-CoA transferase